MHPTIPRSLEFDVMLYHRRLYPTEPIQIFYDGQFAWSKPPRILKATTLDFPINLGEIVDDGVAVHTYESLTKTTYPEINKEIINGNAYGRGVYGSIT